MSRGRISDSCQHAITANRPSRSFAGAALAVLVVAGVVTASPTGPAGGQTTNNADALQARVRAELSVFTGWLRTNGVGGYIGEVGWPNNADTAQWNALDAAAAGVWTTAWATGEWWGCGYKLSVYTWSTCATMDGTLNTAKSQASVIEAQTNGDLRGVNVAGGEFGTPGPLDATSSFSNANPGAYDRAYHYDFAPSFSYLASRGITTVRLPLRWERIQPTLGSALDPAELQRLTAAVDQARNAGLRVILDIHNYGAYWLFDGTQGVRRPIGSASVTVEHFKSLWRQLSTSFKANAGVVGYDLMNEPVGMTGAAQWQLASQAAVDAIRLNGDSKLVLVPGYDWSGARQWTSQHPVAWIVDPANNFRYEAHHYWDRDGSGAYLNSYAAEVADAQSRGYAASPTTTTTTTTVRDTTPPTVPGSLMGTLVSGAASLTWAASSDAGSGVAGYEVWRRTLPQTLFTKVATVSRTSYVDTTTLRGVSYQYAVRAYDRAGNRSATAYVTVTIT